MKNDSSDYPDRNVLLQMTTGSGFPICGFLDLRSFTEEYRRRLEESCIPGDGTVEELTKSIYEGGRAVMVCALPIPLPGEDKFTEKEVELEGPVGIVAPFAADDNYRKSVTALKGIVQELCSTTMFRKRDFRIFSNSRLPEKSLATAAGIGFIGKNSLLITREFGSAVVLSGIILPWNPAPTSADMNPAAIPLPGTLCGSCTVCIEACPGGAIDGTGRIDRNRCLQAMSTGEMPAEYFPLWGNRIYGCQLCQDTCPWNMRKKKALRISTPEPISHQGGVIPLKAILSAPEGGIKTLLSTTAMTQNWIREEFILRNALIAAGNHPEGWKLEKEIERHLIHEDPQVRKAAYWALSRFQSQS